MYKNSIPIDRALVKARPARLNLDPIETLEDFPKLQPTFFRLRALFHDMRNHCLQAYLKVGQIILEACRDEAVRLEMSGDRPIKAWADALGVSERLLYDCRRAAKMFSAEEMEAMGKRPCVTWGHVCAVMFVPSDEERHRLLDMTSEKCLTVEELIEEIVPEEPRKPRGPGRAPGIPKNAKQGLARVEKASSAFARQLREAWFCDQFDLADAVSWIPNDKLTPKTREQLNRTIQSFESICTQSSEIVTRLREASRCVDELLQQRGEDA